MNSQVISPPSSTAVRSQALRWLGKLSAGSCLSASQTPESSGIYVLYGTPENIPKVYIGISTSNMRNRIRSHHVNPNRNWFGVLFAIPIPALLCPAIEAELIAAVQQADSVDVVATNSAEELRHRNTEDVHVEPALEKITDGLQLLAGAGHLYSAG